MIRSPQLGLRVSLLQGVYGPHSLGTGVGSLPGFHAARDPYFMHRPHTVSDSFNDFSSFCWYFAFILFYFIYLFIIYYSCSNFFSLKILFLHSFSFFCVKLHSYFRTRLSCCSSSLLSFTAFPRDSNALALFIFLLWHAHVCWTRLRIWSIWFRIWFL